ARAAPPPRRPGVKPPAARHAPENPAARDVLSRAARKSGVERPLGASQLLPVRLMFPTFSHEGGMGRQTVSSAKCQERIVSSPGRQLKYARRSLTIVGKPMRPTLGSSRVRARC